MRSVPIDDLLVALGCLGVLVIVIVADYRKHLAVALIITSLLSGVTVDWLNNVSVALRQGSILALALLAFQSKRMLPLPNSLLLLSSLIGVTMVFQRSDPAAGLSFALAMTLLHGPVAKTLAGWLRTAEDVAELLEVFVYVAILHVALSLWALATFDGGSRFAGAGSSSPLFAFAGAALAAVLLWAMVYRGGRVGRIATVLLTPVVLLTLLAGQRSGLLGLLVAAAPSVVVGARRRPKIVTGACMFALVAVYLASRTTELFEFAFGRFANLDDEAREVRWSATYDLIRDRPFTGWGAGYADELTFGTHNAFLTVGLELGLFGLALWSVAILVALSWAATGTRSTSEVVAGVSTLSLAWLGLAIVAGLTESKLYRPTNLPALVLLLGLLFTSVVRQQSRLPTSEPRSHPSGASI